MFFGANVFCHKKYGYFLFKNMFRMIKTFNHNDTLPMFVFLCIIYRYEWSMVRWDHDSIII